MKKDFDVGQARSLIALEGLTEPQLRSVIGRCHSILRQRERERQEQWRLVRKALDDEEEEIRIARKALLPLALASTGERDG